jgi:hypothetical protein
MRRRRRRQSHRVGVNAFLTLQNGFKNEKRAPDGARFLG